LSDSFLCYRRVCVCVYVCMYVCMCMYVCVCVYVCVQLLSKNSHDIDIAVDIGSGEAFANAINAYLRKIGGVCECVCARV